MGNFISDGSLGVLNCSVKHIYKIHILQLNLNNFTDS